MEGDDSVLGSLSGRRVLLTHQGAELYGSDRMVLTTAIALDAGGAHVTFTSPVGGPLVQRFDDAGIATMLCDVPVLRKADLRLSRLLTVLVESLVGVFKAVRLISRVKPDVVYVNTIAQPIWLLAARMTRRRTICHVREAETEVRPILQRLLTTPLLFAHQLVYNSETTRRFVETNVPGREPQGKVVYNGKDWSGLLMDAPIRGQGSLSIVVIGRIAPRKGQDVLVGAAKILHDQGFALDLHFAGDVFPGYENYMDSLRSQIESAGLTHRCTFHGFITDVREVLEVADIAVVPSRQEPFGSVAAESMVALRPTCASDVQGLAEIIDHGRTGWLFPSGDSAALAAQLQRMIEDPELASHVAKQARQDILTRFSEERYAEEIRGVVSGVSRRTA